MRNKYALEWIDTVVMTTLNPKRTDVSQINEDQIAELISSIAIEKEKLKAKLLHNAFRLPKRKRVKLMVAQYHSAFTVLLDQAHENRNSRQTKSKSINTVNKATVACLDELLSFIETRFNEHVRSFRRLSLAHIVRARKEIHQRLKIIREKPAWQTGDGQIADVVLNSISGFCDDRNSKHSASFKEVVYYNELVSALELMKDPSMKNGLYTALDTVLVNMNFNNKQYVSLLTETLLYKIKSKEAIHEKVDELLLHYKEFSQLHSRPDMQLNQYYPSLQAAMGQWFRHELEYLGRKQLLSKTLDSQPSTGTAVKEVRKYKITSSLSVDQLALILRSADDVKLLISPSLNAIFKNIVPYLSTNHQENISYDSMRSKSYAAETRDKDIVTDFLQQMIDKIEEY